ncbi:MAG TPA: hypothetical protein QGH10_03630 [Armatimonadota bacterium]|nr:hypothetical protein [Armatimonadota bacterium]
MRILATFALFMSPQADAQQADAFGQLVLADLPEGAWVYVDGELAAPEAGTLSLSTGWHEIQIETSADEQISAMRCWVDVAAGAEQTIPCRPAPVNVTGPTIARSGPAGPRGPMGPVGRAPALHLTSDDTPKFIPALKGELTARLRGAAYRLREVRKRYEPPFYIYDPDAATTTGIAGPAGPAGVAGGPGVHGDVERLRDADGQPLLPSIIEQVLIRLDVDGIGELTDDLATTRPLTLGPATIDQWRIDIHTPEFQDELGWKQAEAALPGGRADRPMHLVAGGRGKRGQSAASTGVEAPDIALSPDQVGAIIEALVDDQDTRDTVDQLVDELVDTDMWAADRERRAELADQ